MRSVCFDQDYRLKAGAFFITEKKEGDHFGNLLPDQRTGQHPRSRGTLRIQSQPERNDALSVS